MAQVFAAGDDGSFDTPVELSIFVTDGPGVSNVQWTKQSLGGSGRFRLQKRPKTRNLISFVKHIVFQNEPCFFTDV